MSYDAGQTEGRDIIHNSAVKLFPWAYTAIETVSMSDLNERYCKINKGHWQNRNKDRTTQYKLFVCTAAVDDDGTAAITVNLVVSMWLLTTQYKLFRPIRRTYMY